MKRVSIAVMALIACLAIVLVPAATAKKKKVKTFQATITLAVAVTEPTTTYTPGSGVFSGQVSSGGPQACRAGRTVTISRGGTIAAQVATQTNGAYSVTVPFRPPAGTYTASVPKITIKNKKTGKKKKCLAATSNPVVVP